MDKLLTKIMSCSPRLLVGFELLIIPFYIVFCASMFVLVPFLCHCICASDYLIDIFIYVLAPCVKMPWLFETKTCPDRYENYTEIREDCNNRNNGVRLLLTMYDGMGGRVERYKETFTVRLLNLQLDMQRARNMVLSEHDTTMHFVL
jgi:hypothetical protein